MPPSSASPDPRLFDLASDGPTAEGSTLYDRLQMPATATPQQLRQSFRRLSKRYHPDTTTLPVAVAEQAFQQLQQAYAVLSDPEARRLYDERLRRALTTVPASASPSAAGAVPLRQVPVALRRALSGGEWFALLLLAVALVLSLVLGLGVAWARGAEMMRWPSWWTELHPVAMSQDGASPASGRAPSPPPAPSSAAADHEPSP